MKSEGKILVALVLNLAFSLFEFFGGLFCGSVAILSDALHDFGDALSIGVSYGFERKSKGQPDEQYTYGYARYSVIGSVITTVILLTGSVVVVFNAVERILHPSQIHYNSMILFAVVGAVINVVAALFTHGGESLNQKAVNLHLLEDVLGWIIVLVGAVVMKFTDFVLIDPILSIGVALFIFVHALHTLFEGVNLFLEKTPHGISVSDVKEAILALDEIEDVHHIHLWSMDGVSHYATMHIVTDADSHLIKEQVRVALEKYQILHSTLELERIGEHCHEQACTIHPVHYHHHHH